MAVAFIGKLCEIVIIFQMKTHSYMIEMVHCFALIPALKAALVNSTLFFFCGNKVTLNNH